MRIPVIAGAALPFCLTIPSVLAESTFDQIKTSGVMKLDCRENSPPYSFADEDRKPRGYNYFTQALGFGVSLID